MVIDRDLGLSGADSDREGFQQLVAAVGLGEVGVVLGLEVSRLARSSADWHRLLEICALTDTLILDEDGLYDPAHFNDRLLLGLKGTMSEAELHVLRARLLGGQRAKASRGELELKLPVGLVYDAAGRRGARSRPRGAAGRCAPSSPPSAAPVRPPARCAASASRGCSSPAGSRAGPTRASWPGGRCCTAAPCACSRTRATRAPSSTGAAGRAGSPAARSVAGRCRARSGTR